MANKDNLPQPIADLFSTAAVRAGQGWKKLPFRVAVTSGPVSGRAETVTDVTAGSQTRQSLNLDKELPLMLSGAVTSREGSTASASPGMHVSLTKPTLLSKTEEELLQEQLFAARMMGVPVTVAGNIVGTLRSSSLVSSSISSRPTTSLSTQQNVTKQTSLEPAQQAQAHLIATAFYNTVKPLLPSSVNETIQVASQIQQLTEQQQQLLAQLNRHQQQQQQQDLILQAPQQLPGPTATLNMSSIKVQPQKWSNRTQTITANKNASADQGQHLRQSSRIASACQIRAGSDISNVPERQTGSLQGRQVISSTSNFTGLQDPRLTAVSYPVRSSPMASTTASVLEPQKQALVLLEKARAPLSVEVQKTQSLEVLQSLKADGYIDSPNRDKIVMGAAKVEPKPDDVDDISTIWPSTLEEDWNEPEPAPETPSHKGREGTSASKSSPNSNRLRSPDSDQLRGRKKSKSQQSRQSSGSVLKGIGKPTDGAPKSPWHASVDAFLKSTKREPDAEFKTPVDSHRKRQLQTPEVSNPVPVISTSLFSTAASAEIPFLSETDTDETISSIDRRVEMLKKQKEQILQDQMDEFCKEINKFDDVAIEGGPSAMQKKTMPNQKGVSLDKDRDRARSKERDKSRLDDRDKERDRYGDRDRDRGMGTRSPPRMRPTDAKRSRSQSHHREVEKRKPAYKSPPSPKRSRSGSLEKMKRDPAKNKESPKEIEKRQGRYPSSDRQVSTERRSSHSPERKRKRPDVKMGEVFIDGRWQRSALITPPPASKRQENFPTGNKGNTRDSEAKKIRTKKDENEDAKMETEKIDTPLEKANQEKKATPSKTDEQKDEGNNLSSRATEKDNMPSRATDKKDKLKNDTSTKITEKKDEKATPVKATEKAREKDVTPISMKEKEKQSTTPSRTEEEQKNATSSTTGKEKKDETSKMREKSSSDAKQKPVGTSAKAQRQAGVPKLGSRTMQEVDVVGFTETSAVSKPLKMTAMSSDIASAAAAAQASSSRVAVSVKKSANSAGVTASPSSQLSDVAASFPNSTTPTTKISSLPPAAESSKQPTDPSSGNSSSNSSASTNKTVGDGPTIGENSRKRKGEMETEEVPRKVPAMSGDSSVALEIKDSSIPHQMGLLKALGVEKYVQDKVMLEWFCYVCGSICHTLKVYMTHIVGRKHKYRYSTLLKANFATMEKELISKLKLLPKQGSEATLRSSILGQSLGLAAQQNLSVSPQAGRSERSYCKICFTHYSCSHDEHVSSAEHKKLELIRPRCGPCNLIFAKIKAYHKHITSLAHKKNVAAQEKPAAPVFGRVTNQPAMGNSSVSAADAGKIQSQQKPNVIGSEFITPISGFFCKLCSKFYNNENTAREVHCATAHHIAKTQQYYASRNQSSGTSFKASQGTSMSASAQAALAEDIPTESSVGLESMSEDAGVGASVHKKSAGSRSSSAFQPSFAQSMFSVGQVIAVGASLRCDRPDKPELPRPISKPGEVASETWTEAESQMEIVTAAAEREAGKTVTIAGPRFTEAVYMEAEEEANKPDVVLPTRKNRPKETVSKATEGIPRKSGDSKHERGATLKDNKVEADKPAETTTCQKAVSKLAETNQEKPERGTKLKEVKSDVGKPGGNMSKEVVPMETERQTKEQGETECKKRITIERTVIEGVEEETGKPQQIIPTDKTLAEEAEKKAEKPGGTLPQGESTSKKATSLGIKSPTMEPSPMVAVQKSSIEYPVPIEARSLEINLQQKELSETGALDRDATSKGATATASNLNTRESKSQPEVTLPTGVTPFKTKVKESETMECRPKISSLKEALPRRASPRRTRSTKALIDNMTKESPVASPLKTRSSSGSETETNLKENTAEVEGQGKPAETAISPEALSEESSGTKTVSKEITHEDIIPAEEALPKETLASNATLKRIASKETTSKREIPPKVVKPKKASASNTKDVETTPKSTSKELSLRISTKESKPVEDEPLNSSAEKPSHRMATRTETTVKVTAPESTISEVPQKQAKLKEISPKDAMSKTVSPRKEAPKGAYQKDVGSRLKAASIASPKSIYSVASVSSKTLSTPNPSHLKDTGSTTILSKVLASSPKRSSTRLTNVQSKTVLSVTETQPKGSVQKKASKETSSKEDTSVISSKYTLVDSVSDKSTPEQTDAADKISAESQKKVQQAPKTAKEHARETPIKTEVTDSGGDATTKTVVAKGKVPSKKARSPTDTSVRKSDRVTKTEKKQPLSVSAASTLPAKQDSSKQATLEVQDSDQGSSVQKKSSILGTSEPTQLTSSSPGPMVVKYVGSKSPSSLNASPAQQSPHKLNLSADASADEERGEYMDVEKLMAGDVIILDEDSDQEMDTTYDGEEDIISSTVGDISNISGDVSNISGDVSGEEEELGDDVWIVEDVEGDVEGDVEDVVGYVEEEEGNRGEEGDIVDVVDTAIDLEDVEGYVDDVEGFVEEEEEGDMENMEDAEGDVEDVEGYVEDAASYVEDVEGYVEDEEGFVEDIEGYVEDVEGYMEDVEGDVEDVEGYVEGVEDVEGYLEDVEGFVEDIEGDEEAGFEMPHFGEMFSIDEVGESEEEEMEAEEVGDQDVHQVEEWEVLSEAEED
ncbi:uncharacterized protein LOC119719977 isoform X2 [Patiria miniata]|uniref:Matrin-type domain-containing protein n=1 Tax=Patiria miniata TaxID=46514 RepID=A0A913Z0F4_PATMI|nr:uncharacterized protein LOC119719977 isoform X2 [Patiria miniata]